MTVGYAVTLSCAVALLLGYLILVRGKELWLTMLYVCVSVVNLGYLLISISKSVEFGIFANDVAYLGSVFLSACMFLTIVRLCGFKVSKTHVIVCMSLATLMFSIVATSGFLPWYYESVELESVNGGVKLVKEYGPLHVANSIYLGGYILAMIITIAYSASRKKRGSHKLAAMLAGIVCTNVAVWACEKIASWEFEFLSVTYIISELMLLFVYWMMEDYVHKDFLGEITKKRTVVVVDSMSKAEKMEAIVSSLGSDKTLTAKEIEILGELIEGKSRRVIASEHHISENTVKTHVTHIYEKLGVSNREQLLAIAHKK